jgi:histidyl-tRNA synthetase
MVAGKRHELVFPIRWFSIGNRFRYERPQRGRLREFYQVDVDIVGIEGGKAEGEAIIRAHQILSALGAKNEDFEIRINSRALVNAACRELQLSDEETLAYIALVDRKEKMDAEAFEAEREAFRRNGTDPLELVETNTVPEIAQERARIEALIAALSARGISNAVFSPTLMRGFLYYTGTVFEVFDTNPENSRALFGGGRYDGLVSLFGGEPVPAVGFAFGDVTLLDFLETHNLLPAHLTGAPDLFIGIPDESDMDGVHSAYAYADALRAQGMNVLMNLSGKSLGDQVKEAVRRTIPYFLAYGSQEAASDTVTLKVLNESREEPLAADAVASFITGTK